MTPGSRLTVPGVTIRSELGGGSEWLGRVVRTEGAIDDRARQLHVVAQVDDPFGVHARGKTPLKIGQYVTAELQGRQVQDALVVPSQAIYQGGYVYIVEAGILQRREIENRLAEPGRGIAGKRSQRGRFAGIDFLGQVSSGVPVAVSKRSRNESGDGFENPSPLATYK